MKIAFIGGGNMATALIAGLAGQLTGAGSLHVVDPNADALARLASQYGVSTAATIDAQVAGADVIVLAVKPQQMREVALALQALLAQPRARQPLLLSIAAGIRIADLARWVGYGRIVRAMPNTPALIAMGITGMVAGSEVDAAGREAADQVMRAVGQTVWLGEESLIDPVTAVSGSGPAYVFYFLEAMQQAALEMGLDAEQARRLALSTFLGAAQLAAQSGDPVEVLRQRVTSKGGTTHAALASMEAAGVKEAIVAAMKAAAARGRELGDELGEESPVTPRLS